MARYKSIISGVEVDAIALPKALGQEDEQLYQVDTPFGSTVAPASIFERMFRRVRVLANLPDEEPDAKDL